MKFEMAPMEGITTYIYRNAHARCFGKADKYYTPFLSLHKEKEWNHREKNEVLPEHNKGIHVIPQVLTNSSEDFLRAARKLADLGYEEININMGCPSGTVTAKGKGAGMLEDAGKLDAFLEEIFTGTPVAVSVKTRLGMTDTEGWDRLLEVYRRYPLKELIVHARVRDDFYENRPDWEAFGRALTDSRWPVCYNGDIFNVKDYERLTQTFPSLEHVMLGRGLAADPYLAEKILMPGDAQPDMRCLRAFHDEIYHGYQDIQMGERNVLFRMKELWTYMARPLDPSGKYSKRIRKAGSYANYESVINELLPASADTD